MNGIEYQQKLNRQNELYQKNITDNNRSNESNIENVKKTTSHRMKEQSKAHKTQLDSLNKSFGENVDRISKEQEQALEDKTRQFELAVDKNKVEANNLRAKNLEEWRGKFQDIKSVFEENLNQRDVADTQQRESLKKNFDENVENIRNTADKDLKTYIKTVEKNSSGDADRAQREIQNLSERYQDDKKSLVNDHLRKQNFMKKTATADIQSYRDAQEKEFNNSRDIASERSKALTTQVNDKVEDQIIKSGKILDQAHKESIHKQNQAFTDRFRAQDEQYNKDVRKLDTKYRAEKISNGTLSQSIIDEQREIERQGFADKKDAILKERNELVKNFDKKIIKNTESYQNKMHDMRIDFAGKTTDAQLASAEKTTKDNLKNRNERQRVAHDNRMALEYTQEKNATQIEAQRNVSKQTIDNLKQDYNRSMNLAVSKSQKDLESAKEEMIFEKRVLQKRLHEQNSKQNSFLKKVYTDKLEGMQNGYEKKIADLEVKVKQAQDNAEYWVKDVTVNLTNEMAREKALLRNEIKQEVSNVKRAAAQKDAEHIKDKNELEKKYTLQMNEQSTIAHRKMKDVIRQSDQKVQKESARFQDIIDQNNKYFNRELQRVTMAGKAERERLVSQYEEQIVQLKRANKDREDSLKEFNKLNS